MSSADNWDSFLNDEDEKTQIDNWGSYSGGDFEDISVAKDAQDQGADALGSEAPEVDDLFETEPLEDFQDVDLDQNYEEIPEGEYFDEEYDDAQDNISFKEEKPKTPKTKANSKGGKTATKDRNSVLTVVIVVLAIAALLAAVFFAAKLITSKSSTSEDENGVVWQENAPSDVVSLVNRYYAARTLVDTYSLEEILDPSVTIDEETLKNEADVVEGYQDIVVYTTNGINDGEYVVYVSYAMKFKNISTAAPGFMPGYIKTDSDGTLRFIPWENASQDNDINSFITKVGSSSKITELAKSVDEAYNQALESDQQLKEYIQSLLGTAAEEETTSSETTTADSGDTTTTTTTAAATSDEIKSEDSSTFTECDYMMYAGDDIRLREAPNTDETTSYQNLSKGSYVQVVAKGTQWVKVIDMSTGNTGYCVSKYLVENKPE